MSYVASGITGASPIWSKIMTALLTNSPPHSFTQPENIIAIDICPTTGTRNCGRCPNPKTEFYSRGTEPKISCSESFFASPDNLQAN
jgi:membrane carboxypeptidase/penicillin-binding protein